MAEKRCVHCNTINPSGQLYCSKCARYLGGRTEKSGVTVWDLPRGTTKSNKKASRADQMVVVCPQCNTIIPVTDGKLPFMCMECEYQFQYGIDHIVPKGQVRKKNTSAANVQQPSTKQHSPMPTSKGDQTEMRLISLNRSGFIPAMVRKEGEIVGKEGTILKEIDTQHQLSILHTKGGWYARSLAGHPMVNGVFLKVGHQVRLMDGDTIVFDREQMRVEITDEKK